MIQFLRLLRVAVHSHGGSLLRVRGGPNLFRKVRMATTIRVCPLGRTDQRFAALLSFP